MTQRRSGVLKAVGVAVVVLGLAAMMGAVLAVMQESFGTADSKAGTISCTNADLSISSLTVGTAQVNVTLRNTGKEELSGITVKALWNETVVGGKYEETLRRGAFRNLEVEVDRRPDRVAASPSNCPMIVAEQQTS